MTDRPTLLAYEDGLVVDTATGDIIEAPEIHGDKLAWLAYRRHDGKGMAKGWGQAVGGYDAALHRRLEDLRETRVIVGDLTAPGEGPGKIMVSRLSQRRTRWDRDTLVGALQAEASRVEDYDDQAGAAADLIGTMIEIIACIRADGLEVGAVRGLAPASEAARLLGLAAHETTTEPWITTAPVLKASPV